MGSEVESAGMTPEQKAGLIAGAAFAAAGMLFTVAKRRKKKQSPVQTTAERIVENPSLKNLYSSARQSLEEARGRIDPKTIEAAKQQLARQAEAGSAAWHSDVQPTARELADRALATAQRIRSQGSERSRELAKRWESDYGPAARSAADEAVAEADQIIASARKRATEISDVARKEYLPKVAPMAAAATGAVSSYFSEGSEKLSKQLKDGKKRGASLQKELKRSKVGRQQQGIVSRAGQGAKDVTGNIFMIGFWMAALGTVIYFGILNEEWRQKVRAYFTDAYDQVSELIEDFQDEDVFGEDSSTERF